jgi:hypothetical protein
MRYGNIRENALGNCILQAGVLLSAGLANTHVTLASSFCILAIYLFPKMFKPDFLLRTILFVLPLHCTRILTSCLTSVQRNDASLIPSVVVTMICFISFVNLTSRVSLRIYWSHSKSKIMDPKFHNRPLMNQTN